MKMLAKDSNLSKQKSPNWMLPSVSRLVRQSHPNFLLGLCICNIPKRSPLTHLTINHSNTLSATQASKQGQQAEIGDEIAKLQQQMQQDAATAAREIATAAASS
jgi:hypothetical protein